MTVDPTLPVTSRRDRAGDPNSPGDYERRPELGIALSGGGYRAMLFHLGSLTRMREGGLLDEVTRFSSVSGGSFMSAWLGIKWNDLKAAGMTDDAWRRLILLPVLELSRETMIGLTIETLGSYPWDIVKGLVGASDLVRTLQRRLRKTFTNPATGKPYVITQLPASPRFVFCATNLESGVLFRMSADYSADYRVGALSPSDNAQLELAMAVAASAGFPPFMAYTEIKPASGSLIQYADLGRPNTPPNSAETMYEKPYIERLRLCDGGVYDNLGLEPLIKSFDTIIASDAGSPETHPQLNSKSWIPLGLRTSLLLDRQVRALRVRMLMTEYSRKLLAGSYIGIATDPAKYSTVPNQLPVSKDAAKKYGRLGTQLKPFADPSDHQRLTNWGYYCADVAVRKYMGKDRHGAQRPWPAPVYPFPESQYQP